MLTLFGNLKFFNFKKISSPKSYLIVPISLFVIAVCLLGSIKLETTQYSFYSDSNKINKSLFLLEPTPTKFSFELRNLNIDQDSYISFKTSDEANNAKALVMELKNRELKTYITNTTFTTLTTLENLNISKIGLEFDKKKENILIKVDGANILQNKVEVSQNPTLTGMHFETNIEKLLFFGQIESVPHSRKIGILRTISLLFLILLTVMIVDWRKKVTKKRKRIKLKWSDAGVAVTLILIGVLSPPGIDDGEILSILRSFNEMGFASSYSNSYPLGQWWFLLNSHWSTYFDQILLLRIPNLIIYFVSWKILDNLLLNITKEAREVKGIRIISFSLFNTFSIAWAGTLRYDPFAILALSLILYATFNLIKSKNANWLILIMISWAFSMSSSLAGWVVTFTIPTILFYSHRLSILNIRISMRYIILAITWLLYLLFFNSNLWLMKSDFGSFAQGLETNRFYILNEFQRYKYIWELWGSAANWSVFISILVLINSIINIKRINKLVKSEVFAIYIVSLSAIPGLWLTTNKYGWHFQAYLPTILVLLTINLAFLKNWKNHYTLVSLLPLGAWISLKKVNQYRYTEFTTFRVNGPIDYLGNHFPKIFGERNEILYFYILYIIIIITIIILRKISIFLLILTIINFVIITPTILYPFLDAKRAIGWQFVKQSLNGTFITQDRCGIPSQTSVVSHTQQLEETGDSSYLQNINLYENTSFNYFKVPRNHFTKLEYKIPPGNIEVALWLKGLTTPQEGTVIMERIAKNKTVSMKSLELNNIVSNGDWQKIDVNVVNIDALKLKLNLKSSHEVFMIKPAILKFENLSALIKKNEGAVNTYRANNLFFPCQTKNYKHDGVRNMPEFQFGFSTNMGRDSIINAENDLIPIGCIKMQNTEARPSNCIYKIANKGNYYWQTKNIEEYSNGIKIQS